jgi:hypothetical protein
MTHKDAGHYAAKHPPEKKLNPKIAEAVRLQAINGKISCASADLLEVRLNKCQLGLHGYFPEKRIVEPAKKVSPELEKPS